MAKIYNYQFEEPTIDYYKDLLSRGMSRKTAMFYAGNTTLLGQSKAMKNSGVFNGLEFGTKQDSSYDERIYYDRKIFNPLEQIAVQKVNFYESVAVQVFNLRLFGYRNVITKFVDNYVDVYVSFKDNFEWKSAKLRFKALSLYDDNNETDKNTVDVIIVDNMLNTNENFEQISEDSKIKLKIINDKIYSEQKVAGIVYQGSSFYISEFFKQYFLNNNLVETMFDDDKEKSAREFMKKKNGFLMNKGIAFGFENVSEEEYEEDFRSTLPSMVNYYYNRRYAGSESINAFVDSVMMHKNDKINSFAEAELAFAIKRLKAKKTKKKTDNKEEIKFGVGVVNENDETENMPQVEKFEDVINNNQTEVAEPEVEENIEKPEAEQSADMENSPISNSTEEQTQQVIAEPVNDDDFDENIEETNNGVDTIGNTLDDIRNQIVNGDENQVVNNTIDEDTILTDDLPEPQVEDDFNNDEDEDENNIGITDDAEFKDLFSSILNGNNSQSDDNGAPSEDFN